MISQTRQKIARQYIHAAAFSVIKVVSSLLLLHVLGQNLSPQQYGVYSLISSTVTVGVYVFGLDLYSYLMRWVPGSPANETQAMFKTIEVFELALTGLVVLLAVSTGLYQDLASLLNIKGNSRLYRAGLLILVPSLVMRETIRYFFAVKRIEIANWLEFLGSSSYVYGLVLLWVIGVDIDLPVVLWLWGFALLVAILYGLNKLDARQLALSRVNGEILKDALAFSSPLFVATLSTQISTYADRFLLSVFHSARETGLYSLVYSLVVTGVFAWGALIGDVLKPYATEYHNRQQISQRDGVINLMLKYAYLVTIPLVVFILGVRIELLQLLAKSEFATSEDIVPVLLVAPVVIILAIPLRLILLLQEKTRLFASTSIAGAVFNTLLNVLLIPKYGLLGAAWASAFAFSAVLVLSYLSVRDGGIVSLRQSKVRELALVNVSLYAFTYFARRYLAAGMDALTLSPMVVMLSVGGVLMLVYTAMILSLQVVTIDEIGRVRTLLNGQGLGEDICP